MSTTFEKITSIVEGSDLPQHEKEELLTALAQAGEEGHKLMLELMEKDASWVQEMSANLQAKQGAVATGDQEAWDKIIDEEEKRIEATEQ